MQWWILWIVALQIFKNTEENKQVFIVELLFSRPEVLFPRPH